MIVRELLTVFGLKYEEAAAQKAASSIDNLVHKVHILAEAFVGYEAFEKVKDFIHENLEFAETLSKTSRRLGMQAEALQELQYAASAAGMEQETLDRAMQTFMIRSAEAAQGEGRALEVIQELGLQLKDTAGNIREPADLLGQVADKFKNLTSQADKARIAHKLFEEEGIAMVNVLEDGSEALRKTREEARLLGAVMSNESVESGEKLAQAMKRAHFVARGLGYGLLQGVLPVLEKLEAAFEAVGKRMLIVGHQTTILKTMMAALGAVALRMGIQMAMAYAPAIIAAAPMIATYAALAAAVVAVIAVVDDLYNLFTGGESLTGRFFEGIKAKAAGFTWNMSEGLVQKKQEISSTSNLVQKNTQHTKVDVHVKTGANPKEIGTEVARMIGIHDERQRRNTYLALVPG